MNVTIGQPTASYGIVGSSAACVGSTVQIFVTVTGTPPFTAAWNDGLQTLETAGTHIRTKTPTAVGPANVTLVNLIDATPCPAATITGSANFTVSAPAVGALSGDTLLSHGEVGALRLALTGAPPFTVTWSDGMTQSTPNFEIVRHVNPATTTTYSVQSLSDSASCGETAKPSSLTVTVLPAVAAAGTAYTVNGTGVQLRRVRLADGVTEATLPLSVPGFAIVNARSLTRRPGTDDYYVLVTGAAGAPIALLDESTGVGTLLGTYTDPFREIGFDRLGRLVATQPPTGGIFSLTPKHLINLVTGAATVLSSGPNPDSLLHLAASPNGLKTFVLYGSSAADGKSFADFDAPSGPLIFPSPLHVRPGEFSGAVSALSYANGYDFVATLGADYYAIFGATRGVVKLGTFDHGAAGLACAQDAFIGRPGTGDDLLHRLGVDGVFTSEGRRTAAPGSSLTLRTESPQSAHAGTVAFLYADVYLDGAEPTLSPYGVPGVHLALPINLVLASFPMPALSSIDVSIGVPPGLAGVVARTQAVVYGAAAKNGVYALSEACEVVFVP